MQDAMTEASRVVITRLEDAKDAFRQKDLCQALYDAGEVVMDGVLVNLHGDEHRDRRRLENRLFRRDTLVHYERDLFPSVIDETLAPHVSTGRAELVSLGHELMMNLAALNAGVDRPAGTRDETLRLYGYMMKFIEGATLYHSQRDHHEARREVAAAIEAFDAEFLQPSVARRRALLSRAAAGVLPEEELPRDVLTVLLRNTDNLHLPAAVMLREVAFFLLAGAHTSATAFTRTLHNIFEWVGAHPDDMPRLRDEPGFLQRSVHETVRLNPSSPVAMRRALSDVTLRNGTIVAKGNVVVIDLVAVNRDPEFFGPDPGRFDPHRQLNAPGVSRYGLSFGHGMHACIGQELAAGTLSEDRSDHEYGLVTAAVQALLGHGVRPDPSEPPVIDASTARPYWGRYPVVFSQ